jgi:hypothetical protein
MSNLASADDIKNATYGGLLAKSAIFFSEFIKEREGDPRDEEWVARARELRGRILFESKPPVALGKNVEKRG